MESKLRIPSVATAVLVLGGACDDDDEKSSTAGLNTSQARQDAVIKAFCMKATECTGEDFDQEECEADYAAYFEEYARISDDCLDAALDYYDCYARLSCEALEDDEQGDVLLDHCAQVAKIEIRCGD